MPSKQTRPVNPDLDVGFPAQRRKSRHSQAPLVAVIAVGGALGAAARYGLSLWLPHPPGTFPWATFLTNGSGCLLIGVLMVLVTEVWAAHRLLRPFLGTGVLGGFTTFSTYAVDTRALLATGHPQLGLVYVFATLVCALGAVAVGVFLARWVTASHLAADRRRR